MVTSVHTDVGGYHENVREATANKQGGHVDPVQAKLADNMVQTATQKMTSQFRPYMSVFNSLA